MSDDTHETNRRGFLLGAATTAAAAGCGGRTPDPAPAAGPAPTPGEPPVNPRLYTFVGGATGAWAVTRTAAVVGESLPGVARVEIVHGTAAAPGTGWVLRGVTSNERYATRPEKTSLVAKQTALGRPDATHAALIPIRKSAAWWALTQDERRAIFEDQSRHVATGLKYLPAVARRLHHCRDLGAAEPFDFVTLFDYPPAAAADFEQMVAELRATPEWKFVDREVDIRLVREA